MFYTALVRSWYGQGLAMPPLRPGFATIIRKNRGDWFASVWNAVKCSVMQYFSPYIYPTFYPTMNSPKYSEFETFFPSAERMER